MAKILLVEDSTTQAQAYIAMLKRHGHTVLCAANGEEGLAKAENEQPEIVLMDIVMPQMDGYSAMRALRQNPQTKHIPVIIFSSKNQDTDKIWAMRQGAVEYLVKPVAEHVLVDAITKRLRETPAS